MSLLAGLAYADDTDDLLEADQAFRFSADPSDRQTLRLTWQIADGYYLYRHKFKIQPDDSTAGLTALELPTGQIHQDLHHGAVEIYRRQLQAQLALPAQHDTTSPFRIELIYQGCADAGFCYLPVRKTLQVNPVSSPDRVVIRTSDSK